MAFFGFNSDSPRRRIPSWVLGGVLSLILVGSWAIYLALAPMPTSRPPADPSAAAPTPAPTGTLRVLAWRGVLPLEVVSGFESDTGVKVAVDRYNTLDELRALADGGALTHDLFLVSGIGLQRLADAGLLSELSPGRLANSANLDAAVTAYAATYDPQGNRGIIAAWGTLGLAFDPAKIAARLGSDAPLDSWSLLFDAAQAAKLADCGIQIVDTPRGAFPIALRYLNLSPDSGAVEDTEQATRLWERLRPSVAKFSTDDVVFGLASGQVCLAMATSGDVFQARAMAAAAGQGPELRYVIPREGAVAWFAMLAIPKASANPDAARRLIDYVLRPEVAARMTNATGYANAVAASGLYVRPEIKNDPALIPQAEGLANFMVETDLSPEAGALRDRFWQLINTPPSAAPPPLGPSEALPPPAELIPEPRIPPS